MPEEVTPAEGNSTEIDWENPSNPYIQRFKDQQAGFTQSQQTLKSFESDPNALISFIQEKHPDLLGEDDEQEDTDTYEEPDEDERPLTVGEWKAHLREQEEVAQKKSNVERFETDLKAVVNGRDLDQWGERAIRYAVSQGEIKGPDDLKKQVDEYIERQQPGKPRPRAPHVPANGQSATEVPDWSKMTPGEINRYMVERVQAEEA